MKRTIPDAFVRWALNLGATLGGIYFLKLTFGALHKFLKVGWNNSPLVYSQESSISTYLSFNLLMATCTALAWRYGSEPRPRFALIVCSILVLGTVAMLAVGILGVTP